MERVGPSAFTLHLGSVRGLDGAQAHGASLGLEVQVQAEGEPVQAAFVPTGVTSVSFELAPHKRHRFRTQCTYRGDTPWGLHRALGAWGPWVEPAARLHTGVFVSVEGWGLGDVGGGCTV